MGDMIKTALLEMVFIMREAYAAQFFSKFGIFLAFQTAATGGGECIHK